MKEKLQEYALIAEIISALCIVLSLIFVGLQVQQGAEETAANTEALRSQVRQAMLETDIGILQSALIMPEVVTRMDDLPENQRGVAFIWFNTMIRSREHYWEQYQQGLLDEAAYQSYMGIFVSNLINSEFYRNLWGDQRYLNPGFIRDINAILREQESNIP